MSRSTHASERLQPAEFPSRKVETILERTPDTLKAWMDRYQTLAVAGIRSDEVTAKIALHLQRFLGYFEDAYSHDRITTVGRRDVVAWQCELAQSLAPATVNNHLASLSGFSTWVTAHAPDVFPAGDPVQGVGEIPLPPLEPRSLTPPQIRSLKNLCDRLDRFSEHKGRRKQGNGGRLPKHAHARPWRDRAIVFVLLSTGLRRQELVNLDLDQLEPFEPDGMRLSRSARLVGVKGKAKTQRTVFLSADARHGLADYLERERPDDATGESVALFLSAASVASRRLDGRLSARSINTILERIGRLHDAEHDHVERRISPLRPHDLRHTFAFQLAEATGADSYELERRLGHRSQRYIARYTNPPEDIAAGYVEEM